MPHQPKERTDPFLSIWIVAVIVLMTVAGVAFLFYLIAIKKTINKAE